MQTVSNFLLFCNALDLNNGKMLRRKWIYQFENLLNNLEHPNVLRKLKKYLHWNNAVAWKYKIWKFGNGSMTSNMNSTYCANLIDLKRTFKSSMHNLVSELLTMIRNIMSQPSDFYQMIAISKRLAAYKTFRLLNSIQTIFKFQLWSAKINIILLFNRTVR